MTQMSYQNCQLCPRRCGVDRTAGQRGFCGMGPELRAARAALHFWEEPVLCGDGGAGAVFFSGCTLRCRYCQNYEISQDGFGLPLTAATPHCKAAPASKKSTKSFDRLPSSEALREVFLHLIDEGASCIDLVTPTHFLPEIVPALTPKLPVPVVYNCGGYESVETLRMLEGLVDVWLPDLKYSDEALARELSGAPDYPEVAQSALMEMFRQTGRFEIENGQLQRGVLIRHLILPGALDNTLGVIDWVADHFPRGSVLFSLMSQYVPMGPAAAQPPCDRRITREEYDAALSWLWFRGLRDGYTQGFEAASLAFVPEFDGTGIVDRQAVDN